MEREPEIQQLLDTIEEETQVTIIHAIESGSRAWGFPSKDSDFDIRFIYHHPKDWYLSPFDKKDTIDLTISDELDTGGWDVGKCLRLLYKGNVPLYEWLNSPVVYRTNQQKAEILRSIANKAFNPKVAFYHYMSLAKKKLLDPKTETHPKSYLYALRALLCAMYIAEEIAIPSVDISPLVELYLKPDSLKFELASMIREKADLTEKDSYLINKILIEFAKDLYETLSNKEIEASRLLDKNEYDQTLRSILDL